MPFRNKYRPSRVKQLEQKAERNGFTSYFVDPHQDYFYKGTWKNNKKSGYGYKVFDKEQFCYEGYFENDLYHGFGRLGRNLPDGTSEVIYEGHWANGKMEGPGRWMLSQYKKERDCNHTRTENTEMPEIRITQLHDSESFHTQLENENETDSSVYDFIYKEVTRKIHGSDTDSNMASNADMAFNDSAGGHLALSDVNMSSCCSCCSYGAEESCQTYSNSTEISSEEQSLSASFQKPLKPTFDPTKPILVTNNKCITFQDLKKIYKEFQNLAREEKKNDTWDEFVNDARFQVRPDPAQERIDYVEPNFRDFRTHCPRGIFYQNINGDKRSVRADENVHDVVEAAKKLRPRKTLGLKSIDERALKFYLYDGMMRENLPNGFGYACFSDDIYYYGNWKKGLFQGKGILMSLNEYSFEGQFENGVRLGHGVYINYQNGYVQRGFWAKGSFVESTIEISYRRQSAIYPVIFPVPDLNVCDVTVDDETSWHGDVEDDSYFRRLATITCGRDFL